MSRIPEGGARYCSEKGSIAVNGVCLTVVEHGGGEFTADVMQETLDRSSLGALVVGSPVNLERPVTLAARLGGHLVPGDLGRYVVEKGSITVDGVSLTVVEADRDWFSVSLIPTTLELTTLGTKGVGDPVNLEVDVVAKYVERMLQWRTP